MIRPFACPGLLLLVPILAAPTACGPSGGDAAEEATSRDQASAVERVCADLENPVDRILCFADRAADESDARRCDDALSDAIRYQCYAVFAERVKDVAPCRDIPRETEDLQGLRDACIGDVAAVAGQPGLCDEIMTAGLRDSCYVAVFRTTGDDELCGRIEDPVLRSTCTGEPAYVQ